VPIEDIMRNKEARRRREVEVEERVEDKGEGKVLSESIDHVIAGAYARSLKSLP
jgi:hypothetical protein